MTAPICTYAVPAVYISLSLAIYATSNEIKLFFCVFLSVQGCSCGVIFVGTVSPVYLTGNLQPDNFYTCFAPSTCVINFKLNRYICYAVLIFIHVYYVFICILRRFAQSAGAGAITKQSYPCQPPDPAIVCKRDVHHIIQHKKLHQMRWNKKITKKWISQVDCTGPSLWCRLAAGEALHGRIFWKFPFVQFLSFYV